MKELLVALTALACLGAPDLAPPGMRIVQNTVAIEWPDAFGGERFVVAPAHGPLRRHDVVRGETFNTPRGPFAEARLYAVPAAATTLPQERDDWAATGWPSAPLPATRQHSVAAASPVHRVHTEVVVDAIDGATIRCRAVRTTQFDRDGNPVVAGGVLLPALATLAGIVLLALFARRRAAETA